MGERTAALSWGAFGPVVLSFTRPDLPDGAQIRRLIAYNSRVAAAFPKAVFTLAVLDVALRPPSSEARQAAEEGMRSRPGHLRSSAQIVDGDGFGGAALRAALAGMNRIGGGMIPTKVFSNDREAVEWMLKHNPDGAPLLDAREVCSALGAFRKAMPARAT